MPTRLEDHLRLARAVDWGYPTNRAIVLVAVGAGVGVGVWRVLGGDGLTAALAAGGTAAVFAFIGWALTREIDPDHEHSAFLAAALAIAAVVLVLPGLDLALQLWILLTLRLANRSTGRTPSWLDTLAVLGSTAWVTVRGFPAASVVAALAFVTDGLTQHPTRRHLAAGGMALAIGGVVEFGFPPSPAGTPVANHAIALGAISALLFVRVLLWGPPRSTGDSDGKPIDPRRLWAARVLALAACWSPVLIGDPVGEQQMAPLACALAGAALWPGRRCAERAPSVPSDQERGVSLD